MNLRLVLSLLGSSTLAFVAVPPAAGDAYVDPPIVQTGESQLFTLVVQLAVWTREHLPGEEVAEGAEGEGKSEAEEELEHAAKDDAVFHFVARPLTSGTHAFEIRQTYSDGSVVHWRGPQTGVFVPTKAGASIRPRPTLLAQSSLGEPEGGGETTLTVGAAVLGGLGLALGIAALAVALARR